MWKLRNSECNPVRPEKYRTGGMPHSRMVQSLNRDRMTIPTLTARGERCSRKKETKHANRRREAGSVENLPVGSPGYLTRHRKRLFVTKEEDVERMSHVHVLQRENRKKQSRDDTKIIGVQV